MKSGFLCSSLASEEQVGLVLTMLGFQRQFFPFVYLGVPITRGWPFSFLFYEILAKVHA